MTDPAQPRLLLRCIVATAAMCACIPLAVPPLSWHWLSWIALVPLLRALDGLSLKQSALVGWVAGVGVITALFTWVGAAFATFGGIPPAAALLAFVGYAMLTGLELAAIGVADWWIRQRRPRWRWLLLPCVFVAAEWGWPKIFPWGVGCSQASNTLVLQVVDLTGPMALPFLVVLVNGAIDACWVWWRERGPRPVAQVATAAVVMTAVLIYGAVRREMVRDAMQEAPRARIGWVQPNSINTHVNDVQPLDAWDALTKGAQEVREQDPDVTVFSESAYPWTLVELEEPDSDASEEVRAEYASWGPIEEDRNDTVRKLAKHAGGPIIVGATQHRIRATGTETWDVTDRRNRLVIATPDRIVGSYDKRHLLVVGEYLPGEQTFPAIREWSPFSGSYSPGTEPSVIELAGLRLAMLVCYEAVWPNDVRDVFEEGDPDVLINCTNDIWFGTQGAYLHKHIVIARAVESRRPLVRVTSTGISTVVMPDGTEHHPAPLDTEVARVSEVPRVRESLGTTVYTRVGDWFPWLALIALVIALFPSRGQSAEAGSSTGNKVEDLGEPSGDPSG